MQRESRLADVKGRVGEGEIIYSCATFHCFSGACHTGSTTCIKFELKFSRSELLDEAHLYLESYQIILPVQAFLVKPPKMFAPLFTTVIVGPLLSHVE